MSKEAGSCAQAVERARAEELAREKAGPSGALSMTRVLDLNRCLRYHPLCVDNPGLLLVSSAMLSTHNSLCLIPFSGSTTRCPPCDGLHHIVPSIDALRLQWCLHDGAAMLRVVNK